MPSSPCLDFHRADTLYATHGLHAFAAKFPPQLVAWALQTYSRSGQTVCDPMMGSGTTLVEAWLHRRQAIGFDLDPLACLIASAKATPLDPTRLHAHNRTLLATLECLQDRYADACETGVLPDVWNDSDPRPALPDLDRWFLPQVQVALILLKQALAATSAPPDVRTLWYALFSSLIVAQTSVANARDLAHSRHRYRLHAAPPDVFGRFRQRLHQSERQMRALHALAAPVDAPLAPPVVGCADSRRIPLGENSVDTIITSPPYANALDYTRAHRFAVAWLADVLAIRLEDYVRRGRRYIGSDRGGKPPSLPQTGIAVVDALSAQVAALDAEKGRLVGRYFQDMQRVLGEIGRILRPAGHAVLVVCPSTIRSVPLAWHETFCALGAHLPSGRRLRPVQLIERTIDDSRRLLPYRNAGAQMAQRMRTEYVLVLQKQGE